MAIGSNSAVWNYGTQTEVISITTADIANAGFSDYSDDYTAWTNTDNVPQAAFIADLTFSAAPTANTTLDLFGRPQNVSDTTQDQNAASSTFEHTYLGSFPLDSAGTTTIASIVVDLPSPIDQTVWWFSVKNNGGQDLKTGSTVDISPMAIVPKA